MMRDIFNKSLLFSCQKPTFTLLGFVLALQSIPAFAEDANSSTSQAAKQQQPAESAQDIAYKEQMIKLSNAIVQKVSEIQAKQKQLDEEVYPAYKPPIQADLDNLKKELDALKLRKTQLESEKTSIDMTKQLDDTKQNTKP